MDLELDHVLAAQRLVDIVQNFGSTDTEQDLLLIINVLKFLAKECTHETPGPKGRRYMLAGEMRSIATRLEYKALNPSIYI